MLYFFPQILIGLVLIIWILYLEIRLKKFFKGGDGANLEGVLTALIKSAKELEEKTNALYGKTLEHDARLKNCVQKTAVVRFNPFQNAGSDQSFSLTLLDEEKNGIVISSLYGREINRIYAKPVKAGASEYQLTEEEKKAIQKAS